MVLRDPKRSPNAKVVGWTPTRATTHVTRDKGYGSDSP